MGWYSFRPKIWTVAPMVNPPAARTMPVIMSKPIHRPQGAVCDRFVVAPRPRANRATRSGIPTPRMIAAMALPGVMHERRYSLQLMPSRIFSRKKPGWAARAWALAMGLLLLLGRVLAVPAPLRERVDPHQQRGPEGHDERRGAERAGHERRVLLVRHAGAERELL